MDVLNETVRGIVEEYAHTNAIPDYRRKERSKEKNYRNDNDNENEESYLDSLHESYNESHNESLREKVDFSQIVDLYHSICVSYPRIKTLSDARKKTIKARLNLYTLDDFETMFKKAEASDFLRGANSKNWTATFDWMIKDANMVKILDGNYDNTKPKSQTSSGSEPYFKDNLMNILTGNM